MGQEEIFQLLKKENRPLSRSQIAELLDEENKVKISSLLSRMVKFHDIAFKELDRFEAEKQYGVMRRMCVFAISEKLL